MLIDQLCPILGDPLDSSAPGSSVPGILQARTLEWVTIPFSRGSTQPGAWTQVSHITGRVFSLWVNREVTPSKSKKTTDKEEEFPKFKHFLHSIS